MSQNIIDTLISECCQAFVVPSANGYICTACGKMQKMKGDTIILANSYNYKLTNAHGAIHNMNYCHDAMNWYDDDTLEIVNYKCPDCGSLCRFGRDLNQSAIYICTNKDCRHVWNNGARVDDLVKPHK